MKAMAPEPIMLKNLPNIPSRTFKPFAHSKVILVSLRIIPSLLFNFLLCQ